MHRSRMHCNIFFHGCSAIANPTVLIYTCTYIKVGEHACGMDKTLCYKHGAGCLGHAPPLGFDSFSHNPTKLLLGLHCSIIAQRRPSRNHTSIADLRIRRCADASYVASPKPVAKI